MGRCYEFGVSIRPGCEHVMVVPPEGGRCECTGCGARCTGQFAACATIIATPGYRPAVAPNLPMPQPQLEAAVTVIDPEVPADGATPVAVGSVVRPDPLLSVLTEVQDLGKQLVSRDDELAELFDRLVAELRKLREEVRAGRDDAAETKALIQRIAIELEKMSSGSSLGLLRRPG